MFKLQTTAEPSITVVDGFYLDPDAVRRFALQQEFAADNRYFRGQRSPRYLFPGIKERFEQLLRISITKWEEYDANGVFQICLGGDQQVYHSDEQRYAGVVYLTPGAPPESGTRILRSRATRTRTVAEAVEQGFDPQLAAARMYDGKLLDSTAWEPEDILGNRYNRLVLWDARLAHAANAYFGSDKPSGRLTHLFFFS